VASANCFVKRKIEAEQKGFLQAAQKLNAMDDGLIQASIARHKGAAGGGGEQQRGEGVTVRGNLRRFR